MNKRRIIYWFILILFMLVCGGAIYYTTMIYKMQSEQLNTFSQAIDGDLKNWQKLKIAEMDPLLFLKELYISHKLIGEGIKIIVVLFLCLTVFLLVSCIIERKRYKAPGKTEG